MATVALLGAILAGGALLILRGNTAGSSFEIALPSPAPTIAVEVTGHVHRPGVYHLPPGSRVEEALAAAGGLTPEADTSGVNMAAPLSDGATVHIYARGEAPQRVNINTAEAWLLEALPGIGEVLAGRIVAYRAEHGPFQRPEDLKRVPGISDAVYSKVKDKITVR